MLKSGLALCVLSLCVSAQVSYPQVPPGLPGTVSIDSLGSPFGGHSFKINVYTGAFTFHTKTQGDFSGAATVVWFGQTDKFNPFSVALGAQSVITFSYATAPRKKFGPGDFVVEGWLDICTQTGQVSLGKLGGSYNITNQIVHSQCSLSPPTPARHFRCIADEDHSLRFDANSGEFALILNGQFRVAGNLQVVVNTDGFTVLRSPGVDNDVTVLIIGDFAQVTVLSHSQLIKSFFGTITDCQ